MRIAWLTAVLVLATNAVRAQNALPPSYERVRAGAAHWQAGGGWRGGFGPAYGGYFAPYSPPPIVAGSWYQRPYPYHFDYYRYRWSGSIAPPGVDMMPVSECPCLAEPAPPAESPETEAPATSG